MRVVALAQQQSAQQAGAAFKRRAPQTTRAAPLDVRTRLANCPTIKSFAKVSRSMLCKKMTLLGGLEQQLSSRTPAACWGWVVGVCHPPPPNRRGRCLLSLQIVCPVCVCTLQVWEGVQQVPAPSPDELVMFDATLPDGDEASSALSRAGQQASVRLPAWTAACLPVRLSACQPVCLPVCLVHPLNTLSAHPCCTPRPSGAPPTVIPHDTPLAAPPNTTPPTKTRRAP